MSAIRFAILERLRTSGESHGHSILRALNAAHVFEKDLTAGSIYGTLKRCASDGLITAGKLLREGSYPPREVFALSPEGVEWLGAYWAALWLDLSASPKAVEAGMLTAGVDRLSELPSFLENRADALENELERMSRDEVHREVRALLVRLHRRERRTVEIAWLRATASTLRSSI